VCEVHVVAMNRDDVSDGYRDKNIGGWRSEVPEAQLQRHADYWTGTRSTSGVFTPGSKVNATACSEENLLYRCDKSVKRKSQCFLFC
jgi:hypothetical protein